MCQLRGTRAHWRCHLRDLHRCREGPLCSVTLHLNCSAQMRKNYFLPSPVLCFHTLLSVQFCFVFGMPHSYLRVKRAFPSIPWNWAGDNLSDRLVVLRVVFPPLDTGACSPNKLGEIVLLF